MSNQPKRYRITIETGNAAFADGNGLAEVARILRELAERIEDRACFPEVMRLYDVNGNHVGEAKAGAR
jgi:hypothetical protein